MRISCVQPRVLRQLKMAAKSVRIGRPRDSLVWGTSCTVRRAKRVFAQVPVGEEASVCGKQISGRYPTNLKAHLKHAHPTVHAEVKQKSEEKKKEKEKEKEKRKSSEEISYLNRALYVEEQSTPRKMQGTSPFHVS